MRLTKGMKKILSLALTGALVITGANVTGGKTEVKAADSLPNGAVVTWEDIDTPFDVSIYANNTLMGWTAGICKNDESKLNVTKTGRYQISTEAEMDLDLQEKGCTFILTSLKAMPTTFGVVVEKISVGTKDYDIDQSMARLWLNDGVYKINFENEYWDGDPHANILKQSIPISAGDVVTFTFKVFAGDPNGEIPADPEPAASAEPSADASAAPSADASVAPSADASAAPSADASAAPSADASAAPSADASVAPSTEPSVAPSTEPSVAPSAAPSTEPSVAPSAEPSVAPSTAPASNVCKKVTAAKKTVSVKRGKTKTITFKITNTNKSAATTDTITVKSSNKKVTAKVTKKSATKITVKVKVNKKAKKNSKAKITLKVGKKSAKTTIKIK